MRTRYSADALIGYGNQDLEDFDPDLCQYRTFHSSDLEDLIKHTERYSISDEAYLIVLEQYDKANRQWDVIERINYYS